MQVELEIRWPLIRKTALFLTFGACFWSLLCLPLMICGELSRTLPTLFPGYLVTIFYTWRASNNMPKSILQLDLYRIGWVSSAIVQGGWLAWCICDFIRWPSSNVLADPMSILVYSWWGISFIVSCVAMLSEKYEDTIID